MVIAVIAILAAVLIPTFAGLIKKANQSVDIQATSQMNTLLASSEGDKQINSIDDVIKTLNKENIDLDNYKPLTSGRIFYWYKTENRILYVDENNLVLYPEEYKNLDVATENVTVSNNSGTFDEIYGSWGREISKSDMATGTGIAQNGKLYVSLKTKNSAGNYYIWSCITEDYFWKFIGNNESVFQISEDNYYWYGLSTSENITKA